MLRITSNWIKSDYRIGRHVTKQPAIFGFIEDVQSQTAEWWLAFRFLPFRAFILAFPTAEDSF